MGEGVTWFEGVARSNPHLKLPTDPAKIANFIAQSNALRCLGIPGAAIYVLLEGGPVQIQETKKASLVKPFIAVGEALDKITSGAAVLADWLGEGTKPVEQEKANQRAEICVKCPLNSKSDPSRFFTTPAVLTIRKYLESKNERKLSTPLDSQLGICTACLCVNSLKVFAPLEHTLKHLSPAVRQLLHPACWILSEEKTAVH